MYVVVKRLGYIHIQYPSSSLGKGGKFSLIPGYLSLVCVSDVYIGVTPWKFSMSFCFLFLMTTEERALIRPLNITSVPNLKKKKETCSLCFFLRWRNCLNTFWRFQGKKDFDNDRTKGPSSSNRHAKDIICPRERETFHRSGGSSEMIKDKKAVPN